MKQKWNLLALLIIGLVGSSAYADHHRISVSVKGMVCSFCAQGITKKLKSEGVDQISVDLEKKLVNFQTKDGKELSNEGITKLLEEAGYSVEKIERN